MPLSFTERTATLSGDVTVEDAEPLTAWLRRTRSPRVRLGTCTHLHAAALQALLAARPVVAVTPSDPFLSRWVVPLLTAPADGPAADEPTVQTPAVGIPTARRRAR